MKLSIQNLGKVSITCNGIWEDKPYDRLCLVNDELYATYISKKPVPAGISLNDKNYWQPLTTFNKEFKDKIDNDILVFQNYVKYLITEHKIEIKDIIDDHIEDINDILLENQNKFNTSFTNFKNEVNSDISNIQTKLNNISYSLIKTDTLTYNLVDNQNNVKGTINIPQDTFLDNATFNSETNEINFIFNTASGKSSFSVKVSSLVETYTNGDGLNLVNKKFSIKLDPDTEDYLILTSNGIKISGITNKINTVQSNLDVYKTSNNNEIVSIKNRLDAVEEVNSNQNTNINTNATNISKNTTSINTLTTDVNNLTTTQRTHSSQIERLNLLLTNNINSTIVNITTKNTEQDTRITTLELKVKNLEDNGVNNPGDTGGGDGGTVGTPDQINALQQKDIEHDAAILVLQNKDAEHDAAILSIQNKNTETDTSIDELIQEQLRQDNALIELELKDFELSNNITSLQSKDVEHTNAISNLQQKDIELENSISNLINEELRQDNALIELELKNNSQDTNITNLQTKDVEHDKSISSLNAKYNDLDNTLTNHTDRITYLETTINTGGNGESLLAIDCNYDPIIEQILTLHSIDSDNISNSNELSYNYTAYTIDNANLYSHRVLSQIYAAAEKGKNIKLLNVTTNEFNRVKNYYITPIHADGIEGLSRTIVFTYWAKPYLVYISINSNNEEDTVLSIGEKIMPIEINVPNFVLTDVDLISALKLTDSLTTSGTYNTIISNNDSTKVILKGFKNSIDVYVGDYRLIPIQMSKNTVCFMNEQIYNNQYIVTTYYTMLLGTNASMYNVSIIRKVTQI